MMKNSRANDLVEFSSQIAYLFQSELVHLKILQVILLFQLPSALHACRAHIDPGDPGLRPAQSLLRRLRCSAAGNQDGLIVPIRAAGPEKVKLSSSLL